MKKRANRCECSLSRLRTVILCGLACSVVVYVVTFGFAMSTEHNYMEDAVERERANRAVGANPGDDGGDRMDSLMQDVDRLLRLIGRPRATDPDGAAQARMQQIMSSVQFLETLQVVVSEMMAIKRSFADELVQIEGKRARYLTEIRVENETVNNLRSERDRLRIEIDGIRAQAKALRSEILYLHRDRVLIGNQPLMYLPLHIDPFDSDCTAANRSIAQSERVAVSVVSVPAVATQRDMFDMYSQCTIDACVDFTRCSIGQPMTVYVYRFDELLPARSVADEAFSLLYTSLKATPYATMDADSACLYLVLVSDSVTQSLLQLLSSDELAFRQRLSTTLRYFTRGNHVMLFAPTSHSVPDTLLSALTHLPVMIAHTGPERRVGFDITISSFRPVFNARNVRSEDAVWSVLPSILPARRRFVASFHGSPPVGDAAQTYDRVVRVLTQFSKQHSNTYSFDFNCSTDSQSLVEPSDWSQCHTAAERSSLLRDSTFCLLLAGVTSTVGSAPVYSRSSELIQQRLVECLLNGAVPVMLSSALELPFPALFTWQRAALRLPLARVTELHFVLGSLTDDEIVELRRVGRLFAEQRLATISQHLDTLLSALRERLAVLPTALSDVKAQSAFEYVNNTDPGWSFASRFEPMRSDLPVADDVNADEAIGPRIDAAHSSPSYRHNYTQAIWMTAQFGGALFGSDRLFPHSPFTPLLPSDAKFRGSAFGFRPLNGGLGGAGAEFSLTLGGNRPFEQFTAVILSYERDVELMLALRRLKGVPYLHSVIVVWNSASRPSPNLVWPIIGVPVHVVKPERNSLNNRFLPFDLIETEAVLCLDDDVTLRHDEAVFAFRAWRETPERIVGFPARYHAWHAQADTFTYDSNYTCEYSMILTGAAFIHKYYFYLYSYSQPSAIRALVDSYMNCEDIAMNFLVSHVTRKPPIKVTSRWTFHCANCPVVLSLDETHFAERHACINKLTEIYGYNPLLMTQYRADSVLFKTRIPSSKQKCFRYV